MVCDRARIQGAGRRQRLTDIRHRRPSEVRGRLQRLHYVPPVSPSPACRARRARRFGDSEEHTSELQSLMRTSYAVFCLKKKKSTYLTSTTQKTEIQIHTNTHTQTEHSHTN